MTPVPARILLSGASGLIGATLVRALAAKRIQTIQLVRKQNGAASRSQAGTATVEWDARAGRPVGDLRLLEGIDAAIHLSGANVSSHRWTPSYKREIVASRVDTTSALVRIFAALRQPPKTFLCASAVGIYGDRGEERLSETSPPGQGFLPDTCMAWEAAADAAKALGIRVAHLRFGIVLAPNGGALKQMLPLFRLGAGGRLGSGRQWMSWIAIEDTVQAAMHLLETESVAGPVNLVAPQPVTNAGFTKALGAALHRPAVLPAPAFALRLAFGEMADGALLASCRALPDRLLQSGFQFKYPEIAPALRALL